MTKLVLQFAGLWILLVLVQAVCNNICLFGVAVPIIFIYFILRLPIKITTNKMMTIAFFTGLVVDTFNNTAGMHAIASTILAASRHTIFNIFVNRDEELGDPIPSSRTIGGPAYFKYLSCCTLCYCIVVFSIQAFTLAAPLITLMRIVASTILSMIIMLSFDSISTTQKK